MEKVEELRRKVDEVDAKIVDMLNERAEVVLQIQDLKRQTGSPLHDPEREAEILKKVSEANQGPLDDETIRGIYGHILYHMRIFGRYE
jgi:chorismate mutase-like protein